MFLTIGVVDLITLLLLVVLYFVVFINIKLVVMKVENGIGDGKRVNINPIEVVINSFVLAKVILLNVIPN